MSEDFLQGGPTQLGRYLYYRAGNTTLSQLKKRREFKISGQIPANLAAKKPDGLLVLAGGIPKAVVEYKQPSSLQTSSQIQNAIKQEIEVAKFLCKLLIVTSGEKTIWVNACNGQLVLAEDGEPVKELFDAKLIAAGSRHREHLGRLEELIDKIDHSLSATNDQIALPKVVDPTNLAKAVWQKIWIHTGKEPEKCLYNVVELFVFKFLSDVDVLDEHNNFSSVFKLVQAASAKDALQQYANICRKRIQQLFPPGDDRTTIINGTIFVNERGEANEAQAGLFAQVMQDLQNYDSEHGSFKYIQKEFKTRLYEAFLRQNAGVGLLGQYFTPRNVVQAIVAMSDAAHLRTGARLCDPFCGVGGFLLEAISENEQIFKEFEPVNGKIEPGITVVGYDKGSAEKEDERTIILAKANMLIYFSDLLVRHHSEQHLEAFAGNAFNKVFRLLRTNLGTFARISDEPYDLILTNPPYETSGSRSLKQTLDEEGLSSHYTAGGRGTEALAIEWIVKNLKAGGQAIVVVPDGLLNQEPMLAFLKDRCFVEGIASLPIRTFYSTPKKTYILALRKKAHQGEQQRQPVFTYLASEIGETRDANRWPLQQNDLHELASLFKQFKGDPQGYKSPSQRCRLVPFDKFKERAHWLVDRWWSHDHRVSLGAHAEASEINEQAFFEQLDSVAQFLSGFVSQSTGRAGRRKPKFKTLSLGDSGLFSLEIGKRLLKQHQLEAGIPVFSSNVRQPFGFVAESNLRDFAAPSLIWGIDGLFDWGYVPENTEFATTDHCGRLLVKAPGLLPKYLHYALSSARAQYGFDRTYRASLKNVREAVSVAVPVKPNGEFDLAAQTSIAARYERLEEARTRLLEDLEALTTAQIVLDH